MKAVQLLRVRLFLCVQSFAKTQQLFQSRIWLWNFATHVTQDSPQPRLQLSQPISHTLELLCMSVTAHHHGRFLGNSRIRLAKLDAAVSCGGPQFLNRFQIQLGISGIHDVLLPNCRADVDLCQLSLCDQLIADCNRHRFLKQHHKLVSTN